MAGEMHVPANRQSCYRDGAKADAAKLLPRAHWSFDQGACCGDAVGADARERQLHLTPSCLGCVKRLRSMLIDQGEVQPYERVITRPVVRRAVA